MNLMTAVSVELMKVRHSTILFVSVIAAVVFPLLIGFVMTGATGTNPAVVVDQTVASYIMQFQLIIAIGGLIGFGFLFSWIFGREYSDGTVTALLALPISRLHIVAAKFIVATVWCTFLGTVLFIIGSIFTSAVLPETTFAEVIQTSFGNYALICTMVIGLSMPVALVASVGRGYLAPLGFVVLTIVAAQLMGAVGVGPYFPWAVPGLLSGVAGEEAMRLGGVSLVLPFLVGVAGTAATLAWWRYADQT